MRRALERFESVARAPWFNDALWLFICAGIVSAALLMRPSYEAVSLFGFDVPVLCTWRRFTGMSCPGCGLTRSFVFFAHGRLREAFEMNVFGPAAFVWVFVQIPWKGRKLWLRRKAAAP